MAGRRKKSTPIPKLVPKEVSDEHIINIEQQLQDGNSGGEIVISVEEDHDFVESCVEEEPYIPEVVIIKMESDRSSTSSPHPDNGPNRVSLHDADDEQDLDSNPLSEPPYEIKNEVSPTTPEVVVNETQSRNQQDSTKPFSSSLESRRSSEWNTSSKAMKGEMPHVCEKCELSFFQEIDLLRHRRVHFDHNMFSCDQCTYRTPSGDYLMRHMKIHSSGKDTIKCKYCSYTSRFRSTVNAHELIHIGTKPYCCALCEYRTNDKNKLIPHLRRHYGWKRFKCKKCNWKFVVKAELRAHMKVHSKKTRNPGSMQHWKSASSFEIERHNAKLKRAAEAVKEGMPLKMAAELHCVTVSTLFYRLYPRALYPPGKKSIKIAANGIKTECGNYISPTLDDLQSSGKQSVEAPSNGTNNANSSCNSLTRTVDGWHYCNLCGYRTSRRRALRIHMERHSEKDLNSSGNESFKMSSDEIKIEESNSESPMRNGERPFSCSQCGYRTSRSTTLRAHMKQHAVESEQKSFNQSSISTERRYSCNQCDYRASRSSTLQSHMKRHLVKDNHSAENESTAIAANEVKNEESNSESLSLRDHHSSEYKSTPMSTNGIESRGIISESPSLKAKRTLTCHVCEYSTSDWRNFRKHSRSHTGERILTCHGCSFSTTYMSSLRRHMRSCVDHCRSEKESIRIATNGIKKEDSNSESQSPKDKKTFNCHVCEFSTVYSRNLKRHLQTHAEKKSTETATNGISNGKINSKSRKLYGEKKYSCNQCSFRSARYSTVQAHVNNHEERNRQKLLYCDECDYSSIDSSNFKKHIRTHTGERPFPCEHCTYRAARLSTLRAHMIIHEERSSDQSISHRALRRKSLSNSTTSMDVDDQIDEAKAAPVTFKGTNNIEAAAAMLPEARVVLHNVMNEQTEKPLPVKNATPSGDTLGNPSVIKEKRIDPQPDVKPPRPLQTPSLPKVFTNHWPIQCNACSFKMSTFFELEQHRKFHLGYPCSLCNFRSMKIDDLKCHVMSAHII